MAFNGNLSSCPACNKSSVATLPDYINYNRHKHTQELMNTPDSKYILSYNSAYTKAYMQPQRPVKLG